jgi:hypothetical protein
MNQSAFLNQLESSKLNQKYHIATQSNAVPIKPGQRRNRTTNAAAGLDAKDAAPAYPKAIRLEMRTPTRENAATAQAKYVRFAAGETIQLRRIGRYSICRSACCINRPRVIQVTLTRRSRDCFSGRLGPAQKILGINHYIPPQPVALAFRTQVGVISQRQVHDAPLPR